MKQAYFVTQVTVKDPETGGDVELEVYKHPNGGMFAMDASYLADEDEDYNPKILDPFDIVPDESKLIELVDPPEID